jgi:hypothetical protein
MTIRYACAILGAAVSAAALALAPALPAQGAESNGWRVVFTDHYGAAANQSSYQTVVATSGQDAWAFGLRNFVNNRCGAPVAEHWDGSAWQHSALPKGLISPVAAVSAPAAGDVWAVTEFGGDILHWNGSAWSVAEKLTGPRRPCGLGNDLTGVTAFSPDNVWVFGGGGISTGFGAWHFNGKTWTKLTGLAAGIFDASALSPTNIWAVGSVKNPDDAILHYNGKTWRQVTAPALKGLSPSMIVLESATNIWVTGHPQTGSAPQLLHLSKGQWVNVPLPQHVTGLESMAPDGQGGFWLVAGNTHGSWIWHRSAAGRWSRTDVDPGMIALIPGTTSLLGASDAVRAAGGWNAVVWAYGTFG